MNKNDIAVNALIKGIISYVQKIIDDAPMDKTFTAIIKKVNSDNTYTISLNGVEYKNIPTIGATCSLNETVRVLVPQNNYSNIVILKS